MMYPGDVCNPNTSNKVNGASLYVCRAYPEVSIWLAWSELNVSDVFF